MIFKKIRGRDAFRARQGKKTYIVKAVGDPGAATDKRYRVTVAFAGEAPTFTTRPPDDMADKLTAMEFCEAVAAGDIDIEEIRNRYALEDTEAEREAIDRAMMMAKGFRELLDQKGLKYTDLLELMDKQALLSDIAHHQLLEMEGVGHDGVLAVYGHQSGKKSKGGKKV